MWPPVALLYVLYTLLLTMLTQIHFICMLIYLHAHLGWKLFKISNFQCLYIYFVIMYCM